MKDVRGKVVVVTGGTRGMGKRVAERFALDGARVVLLARTRPDLDECVLELEGKGCQAYSYAVDVSDYKAVVRVADLIENEVGPVDVLVNNAGVVYGGPFLDVSPEAHAQMMAVNVNGCIWTMKAFLPGMAERNSGHVVNVASAAAYIHSPLLSTYCASKAALVSITDSMRMEMKRLGKKGVKFTLVCPGFVNTGMFEGAKPPGFTRWLDPDYMADKIYEGFKRNRTVVAEPLASKLAPGFRMIWPKGLQDLIINLTGVADAMTEWVGNDRQECPEER